MKLTDLQPLEKWKAFEKEIYDRSGLNSSVFNPDGIRITDFVQWSNQLCPTIKANDKGQAFICAVAHMNIAGETKQTRKYVIEECDAGFLKLVVPIFFGDDFIGAVGACGLRLDDGEVDTFLINKVTDIDDGELERLSEGIGAITTEKAKDLAEFIEGYVEKVVADFQG